VAVGVIDGVTVLEAVGVGVLDGGIHDESLQLVTVEVFVVMSATATVSLSSTTVAQ
jgi:hypothetical protein